jgi:homocysteine S-methyltransferase
MVEKAHFDYLAAGAMVLTTNTFGANEVKLARHGLADRVEAINEAGVRIARRVAGDRVLVAGSIGPSGLIPDIFDAELMTRIRRAFGSQARALLAAGVDAIVLETFRHPVELQAALSAVRPLAKVPIVATMTFDEEGRVGDGHGPERVAELLASWGADVVGANCGEGPSKTFDVVSRMLAPGLPVIAQPNAGHPSRMEGRVLYMATPEYFGEYTSRFLSAGIRVVGGCCGSTPDHIRQVASEVRMASGGRIRIEEPVAAAEVAGGPTIEPPPLAERSDLGRALAEGFVVSVEVDPPQGVDPARALDGARTLRAAGVRFVNIADGPRATARMSPLALACLLKRDAGVEPIVHVTCRDRNLLGIQADLLGAHSLGLRNVLIITGDPSKLGDYPEATTVYDLDSIGLLRLTRGLNHGLEPSGRRMGGATAFVMGTGAEPGAADLDREVARLTRKVDAGAEFVMTQPVYDLERMSLFLDRIAPLGVPVMLGVLPLASHRNAEFLHNEVPGMSIPQATRDRMKAAGPGAAAREEGIRIAREVITEFAPRVRGVYVMPPFDRYETALAVLDGLELPGANIPS